MNAKLAGIGIGLLFPLVREGISGSGDPQAGGSPDTAELLADFRRSEYAFQPVSGLPGVWTAPSRSQGLRSRVSAAGIEIFPRSISADGKGAPWKLGLCMCAVERGKRELVLTGPVVSASGARATLDHGVLIEWLENGELGIEQGWTLGERPAGEGTLRLTIGLSGGFEAEFDPGACSAVLRHTNASLPYVNLRAWDASGRALAARFVEAGPGFAIEIDDEAARYPLTIDPVLTWIAEGDQILADFAQSVAGAGDVNGDGYDDVIIGARFYDNGQVDEGRAYVYHGSASGLAAAPAWVAEPDLATALFGHSVAGAGDVNGDGFDDVIVGAKRATNGETEEGRAYVYLGSASGLATSPAWTAESDQAFASFGESVACAGSVNGDMYSDVIVGASRYANGQVNEGRAYVYLGSASGLSTSPSWIAEPDLIGAFFGQSVSGAGDVNGDGFSDVIVGAISEIGQPFLGGAFVYHGSATPAGLSASPSWTVQSTQSAVEFGFSVSSAGSVNGDVYADVVVGARLSSNGQTAEGQVFVYHGSGAGLSTSPAWTGESDQVNAEFGTSVSSAGDVDGDGYSEVIVGARYYDSFPADTDEGRAYLYSGSAGGLSTRPSWTAEANQVNAYYGFSVADAGDVDGDGYDDFLVGAYSYDAALGDDGRAYLYSTPYGQVLYQRKIADGTTGGLPSSTLSTGDGFGAAIALLGDLDNDGNRELAVGAPADGPTDRGAVYILEIDVGGSVLGTPVKIDGTGGGFGEAPDDGDGFGVALAGIGDLNGDGIEDLAVGASNDEGGGSSRGAIWILFLNANGTVASSQKISSGQGGFAGTLVDGDQFGVSLSSLGDLNGGGLPDLAVGAIGDDDGLGTDLGAIWILFLNANGTVASHHKISDGNGGFPSGALATDDHFGSAIADLGDLDGSGASVKALAIGEPGDNDAGVDTGKAWILFLASNGTVLSHLAIGETYGGFAGDLQPGDFFGQSIVALGDVGGPGIIDIALGIGDDSVDPDGGAVWVLSLDAAGAVVGQHKNFNPETGSAANGDRFGQGLASLGDLDGDGRPDLAAGAYRDDQGATEAGSLWIQFLNNGTLSLLGATTWTGAVDAQWALGGNWTGGVPDQTKTAIVPDATTTPNDPSITVTGQQCNSLWIQSEGTLDISAGSDSLSAFSGATVSGPITGSGELVFPSGGTLAGSDTIELTFDPAVRADASLELQGGPLTIAGSLEGNTSVSVAALATIDVGESIVVTDDLSIDGNLEVGDSLTVGETLFSSSGSVLDVGGPSSGACVSAGQVCLHGDVITGCSLTIERSVADTTSFEADTGWPGDVVIDVAGTVNLTTADLLIGGDFLVQNGTLALGVDSTITTNDTGSGILIADIDALAPIAMLDVGGRVLQVPAAPGITVGNRGKLNIGAGGRLELEGSLTVESGGTLCLDGVPSDPATISNYSTNRYAIGLDPGSTLAAKGFWLKGMTAAGLMVGPLVTLAAAPYDLRGGAFDDPAPGGVLLDIERTSPTQLRYLRFDNSLAAGGVFNVRVLAGAPITLVNWSGDLALDAATAETFDDDPGEPSAERIVWAPPQASDVQDFTASWSVGFVKLTWNTLDEVDSQAFVVRRSTEPPTVYATVGEAPSVGPGSYELHDLAYRPFEATRYRLLERLTHGKERLIDEVVLPASGVVIDSGGTSPAPPMATPQPIVVGAGGAYPDVRSALGALERSHREVPVTLVLATGRHGSFELGPLGFDLCLVARRGAVVDAALAPVRIEGLRAQRSVELVGLVIDARGGPDPALILAGTSGVVLLQDVELRGAGAGPRLRLTDARAVVIQGGAVEGELLLEHGSRATASGVRLFTLELIGRSVMETRGLTGPSDAGARGGPGWSPVVPGRIEPGSRWIEHPPAPDLTVDGHGATLEADELGIAWLGVAPRLGFQPRAWAWIEGVLLLEPTTHAAAGPLRSLKDGQASWDLGRLPPGECFYLQGLVLDPVSGRARLTDVVRIER